MTTLLQIISILAILIGTFFSVVGVLGYIRLPDVYTRLHATGKVGVFGAVFLSIAAVMTLGIGLGRGLMLILLLLVAGPVTSHALASAAYRLDIPMKQVVRNDLQQHKQ